MKSTKTKTKTKTKPKQQLSRLEGLDHAQLQQLAAWLEEFGYKKVVSLAQEQFGRVIPIATLRRFYNNASLKDLLDDSPASRQAAAEIIANAASGENVYTPAAIQVLEQTAFNLSLTCAQIEEDMQSLERISTILVRNRNTFVRERMATVQERKCELRAKEIDLRYAKKPAPSEDQIDDQMDDQPDSPSAPRCDIVKMVFGGKIPAHIGPAQPDAAPPLNPDPNPNLNLNPNPTPESRIQSHQPAPSNANPLDCVELAPAFSVQPDGHPHPTRAVIPQPAHPPTQQSYGVPASAGHTIQNFNAIPHAQTSIPQPPAPPAPPAPPTPQIAFSSNAADLWQHHLDTWQGPPLPDSMAFADAEELEIASLPTGIDRTIDPEKPLTWPLFYSHLIKIGRDDIVDYLRHNQIRVITPCTVIPHEYFGFHGLPSLVYGRYNDELLDHGIPYYVRHPRTSEALPGTYGIPGWDELCRAADENHK